MMPNISSVHELLLEARLLGNLSQRELAELTGTSQSAIANLELGRTNPTVATLSRMAQTLEFELRVELVPLAAKDPLVECYKQDVDRTLLRQNLQMSVDERIRTLGEWQENGRELQRATRAAKARR